MVCLSTFNDDIGSEEKFTELANLHLQDMLICAEMFLAALMHREVFSYKDFENSQKKTVFAALKDMVLVDVFRDVANLATEAAVGATTEAGLMGVSRTASRLAGA